MRLLHSKKGVVVILAAVVLVAGGWLVFKPDQKNTTVSPTGVSPTGQPSTASNTSGSSTAAFIETNDFKYEIPAGWLQIKKSVLDQTGATSGIGRVSFAASTFRTKVSSSTPKDNNELQNNTLDDIKRNAPHFVLISSVSTKVNNKSGQVFTYTYTDTDGKIKYRQQLSAIPNNGKTFFLLASSLDSDFDKQVADFNNILNSFKFK